MHRDCGKQKAITGMIRQISLAAIALAALCAPATAADLGGPKPATLAQIQAMPPPSPLGGCYAEGSIAGTFLAAGDRNAALGAGVGCAAVTGIVIVGGTIRGDFSTDKSVTFAPRVGILINPNLAVYGLGEYKMPNLTAGKGQLALGAGLETSIGTKGLSAFVEATAGVASFGPNVSRDDVTTRFGLRYRF